MSHKLEIEDLRHELRRRAPRGRAGQHVVIDDRGQHTPVTPVVGAYGWALTRDGRWIVT